MNERADGVNRFLGRRPLALFALCYGVGALAGYYAHVPPLWYGVPGALALVAFALRRRAVLLLIALALIGASLTGFSARRPAFPVDETALSISGRVAEPPGWNGTSGVMALERVTLGDGRAYPWRLRVYVYGEQLSAHAGDAVSFTGELFEPKGRTNPGGFDFARFLWARGTPLCASAKPETLAISPGASWVGALRERITRAIERAFPGNAPLAQALVLGDKSALSDALADDFRIAGLSHLLAVSGLHISCLALALERLLRLLRCGRRASLCVTLLLLAAYAGLIGFPASVLRAALMFALVRSAPLFGRPADALTGLSAAFVLILLTRPLSIGDAGFQLSFAAVGSMLLLREPVQKLLRMPGAFRWPGFSDVRVALRWLWAWACNLFCVSVAVQLGTLPVLVMTFGAVSLCRRW